MSEYRKELGEGYFGFNLPTQVNYANVQNLVQHFWGIYEKGVQQQGSTDSWHVASNGMSDLAK
jgi:hypothetical protein